MFHLGQRRSSAPRFRWIGGLARRLSFEPLEDRLAPAAYMVTGPTPGTQSAIQTVGDPNLDGSLTIQQAFPIAADQTTSAYAVAAGDANGSGQDSYIAAVTRNPTGATGTPFAFLYRVNGDGTMTQTESFAAFEAEGNPQTRAFVAFGDLDGDHKDELILSLGGPPGTVKIIRDNNNNNLYGDDLASAITLQPFGTTSGQTAVRVAAGDLGGTDLREELVFSTAGTGTTPQIAVFQNTAAIAPGAIAMTQAAAFSIDFGQGYVGGAFVAVGEIQGASPYRKELIVGQGNRLALPGMVGDGLVQVLQNSASGTGFGFTTFAIFDPFPTAFGTGVNVGAGDLNQDGWDEIIAGQLRGANTLVASFQNSPAAPQTFALIPGVTPNPLGAYAYGTEPAGELTRGAFVAVAERNVETLSVSPFVTIPDNSTIFATLSAPNAGIVRDLSVQLNIATTAAEDIDVVLELDRNNDGVAEVSVTLFADIGGLNDNIIVVLNANNLVNINVAPPIDGQIQGNFQPVGSLAAFLGGSGAGTWRLIVTDDAAGDVSALNEWSLILGYGQPTAFFQQTPSTPIPDNDSNGVVSNIVVPQGTIVRDLIFALSVSTTNAADIQAILGHDFNNDGTVDIEVNLFANVGGVNDDLLLRLWDDAIVNVTDAQPVNGQIIGDYQPENAVSPLFDQYATGTWSLRVIDDAIFDNGTLNSWSLRFIY